MYLYTSMSGIILQISGTETSRDRLGIYAEILIIFGTVLMKNPRQFSRTFVDSTHTHVAHVQMLQFCLIIVKKKKVFLRK